MSASSSNPRRRAELQPGLGQRRRGFVLLTAAAMVFLILLPAIGLAIDVGLMYLVQSWLAAATDAASLAGARALSRGADDTAQRANAESTAATYFRANFPTGYFSTTHLSLTTTATTDSTYLRSVTTTASVDLPLIFMRVFRVDSTNLKASAKATRRDVNVMIVMDRSTSLTNSGACDPLKAAAANFVEKFAEGRDYLGLITFATSSRVDAPLSQTFKTNVEGKLNSLVCTGGTSSAQALWQGYVELAGLAQTGALNVIVFFTDGRPTAVTESFPIRSTSHCNSRTDKLGVLTPGYNGSGVATSVMGLFNPDAPPLPLSSDLTLISNRSGCSFANSSSQVGSDVTYAPVTDYWGNSLTSTGYRSVTYSGAGLDISQPQNVENFSTNAADHCALRVRRGDADAYHSNRTLEGTMIYTIGLGSVDDTLLKRMANDPTLNPNPVAAGNQGRYVYAANATDLDLAFTRVASELLRLAR